MNPFTISYLKIHCNKLSEDKIENNDMLIYLTFEYSGVEFSYVIIPHIEIKHYINIFSKISIFQEKRDFVVIAEIIVQNTRIKKKINKIQQLRENARGVVVYDVGKFPSGGK